MSLVATRLQNLRVQYPNNFDKAEWRPSKYGVWDMFRRQSAMSDGIMSPAVKKVIEDSVDRTIEIPVMDFQDVVLTSTRSCTVTASENTSAFISLTFNTYGFGFTMYPARHKNNEISYQADFDKKMKKGLLKLAATLDTAGVNVLENNKNLVFPAALTNYYPVVGNTLQVTNTEKNDFFNKASSIMEEMDFYENINVAHSTSMNPIVNRLINQGNTNAVNEQFQFRGYSFYGSNRVPNGVGMEATTFLVPDGYIGMHHRLQIDNMMGSKTGNGKEWGTTILPMVGIPANTFYYDDCQNATDIQTSGTASLARTKVEYYFFDVEVVFAVAYNQDPNTRFNPILKAEIAAP